MYFVAKAKSIDYVRRFDYLLFFTVLIISVLGLIVLKSATHSMRAGASIYTRQWIAVASGLALAFFLSFIDYRIFRSISPYLYLASILMLGAVIFIGVGDEQVGAARWLSVFGIFTFQPSEIAKISFVVFSAAIFEKMVQKSSIWLFLLALLCTLLPVALIVRQPDLGTALAFLFGYVMMLFVCGIKLRYLLVLAALGGGSLPILWRYVLEPYQQQRFLSFVNPEFQTADALYQIQKAEIAIGSGRMFGQGLFQGIQTQNNGIPVKESDFIFSVIGEELGFAGAMLFILLFAIFIIRLLHIGATCEDRFGSMITIGTAGIFFYHVIQNIGMNIGLMPITGLALPFVSAGGSSILASYVAIGLVLSVSLRRKVGSLETGKKRKLKVGTETVTKI